METKKCPKCKKDKEVAEYFALVAPNQKMCIDCRNATAKTRNVSRSNSRSGISSFMRFAMHGITDRDY
jgi:hypothetical protein